VPKVRPIATHNRRIQDYASWRGLLVMTGLEPGAGSAGHIVRSPDGAAAVWLGAVDDLWSLGKPVGVGGPWRDTAVRAGEVSDPYLLTGYDRKTLTLSHQSAGTVRMEVEIDLTGTGTWVKYAGFEVPPGRPVQHAFPEGFQAYWLRVSVGVATPATAWLVYE
jgi:hypothetical protein